MHNTVFINILLFFCLISLNAQESEINNILESHEYSKSGFGISVFDIEKGEKIIDINANQNFVPASTLKIITTFSALHLLGSDYRYETSVYVNGTVNNGTLQGDLIIRGSGDPSLGSPEENDVRKWRQLLDDVYSSLGSHGINCIDGNIVIDQSIFDPYHINDSWAWDDLCNYYAAGALGFNIHENYYRIDLSRSTKSGMATNISSIYPHIDGLRIDNKVVTASSDSGDQAYLYGDPYGDFRVLRGTIPSGSGLFSIKGAIADPPKVFLRMMKKSLEERGIQSRSLAVNRRVNQINYDQCSQLLSWTSPPLSQLVRRANLTSNNMYCESFLKVMMSNTLDQVTNQDGIRGILGILNDAGIDLSGFNMVDGSGLSLQNRCSSELLTKFLLYIIDSRGVDHVIDHLPMAKQLALLNSYKWKHSVWLKSGSMKGVRCYAGVMKTEKQRWLVFSIMMNDYSTTTTVKKKIFKEIIDKMYRM